MGIRGTITNESNRADTFVRQVLGRQERRSETSRELAKSRMNRTGRADIAPVCQLERKVVTAATHPAPNLAIGKIEGMAVLASQVGAMLQQHH